MKRRTILRRSSVLGAAALAGCLSEAAPGGNDDPNESDPDDAEPEADGENDGVGNSDPQTGNDDAEHDDGSGSDGDATPELTDSAIEITEISPGEEIDDADIEFDRDADAVIVDGTIHGSDACQTATLGSVDYDAEADELSVDIVTTLVDDAENRTCMQAIVEIDYTARAEFEGGLPSSATVSHDGRAFVSAGHGSSSASGTASSSRSTSRSGSASASGATSASTSTDR